MIFKVKNIIKISSVIEYEDFLYKCDLLSFALSICYVGKQEKVFGKSTLSVEKGAWTFFRVEKLKLDCTLHICAFIHLKSDYTIICRKKHTVVGGPM